MSLVDDLGNAFDLGMSSKLFGGQDEERRHISLSNLILLDFVLIAFAQELLDLEQIVLQATDGMISLVHLLLGHFGDDVGDGVGNIHANCSDHGQAVGQNSLDNIDRSVCIECRLTREQRPEKDA